MLRKTDIPDKIKGYETLEYYDDVLGWFPCQERIKGDENFNPDQIRIRRLSKEERRFHSLVKPKQHCTKMLEKIRNDINILIGRYGNGLVTGIYEFPYPSENIKKKYLLLCKASKRYKEKIEVIDFEMFTHFNKIVEQKSERDG